MLRQKRIPRITIQTQAPITLEWNNTPGTKTNKPKVVNTYIIVEATSRIEETSIGRTMKTR